VTVEQRALADLEVDVFVAIHIPHAAAITALEVERHGLLHFADAAVHARSDAALRALEETAGLGERVSHLK
jgi:hypothetical protein